MTPNYSMYSEFGNDAINGWKNEDPKSQEKTNRDRVGQRVHTPNGFGSIHVEHIRPTFSKIVPYVHVITVKHEDGSKSTHTAKNVKLVKDNGMDENAY